VKVDSENADDTARGRVLFEQSFASDSLSAVNLEWWVGQERALDGASVSYHVPCA
jgi:hypothetical protein